MITIKVEPYGEKGKDWGYLVSHNLGRGKTVYSNKASVLEGQYLIEEDKFHRGYKAVGIEPNQAKADARLRTMARSAAKSTLDDLAEEVKITIDASAIKDTSKI
jgi:hypothetical protein